MDPILHSYFAGTPRDPWTSVTDAQLRHWTGDFCGMFLPRIAPIGPIVDARGRRSGPDPRTGIMCGQFAGMDDGLLFTPHLDAYWDTPDLLDHILREYFVVRGYTHMPINLTSGATTGYSYGGTYPNRPFDRALVNGLLRKVWEYGIPVGVAIGLDDVDSDQAVIEFLALLDDRRMLPIAQLGFEIDHETSRQGIAERFERWGRLAPDVRLALQFSSGHGAGDTPEVNWWGDGWVDGQAFELPNYVDGVEAGTYTKVMDYSWAGAVNIPNLQFYLLDNADFRNPTAMVEDCGDTLVRLQQGGYRWNLPRSFDVIAMELTAYEHTLFGLRTTYDDGEVVIADEAYGLQHAKALLDVAYLQPYTNWAGYAGQLAGFCNGGAPR